LEVCKTLLIDPLEELIVVADILFIKYALN